MGYLLGQPLDAAFLLSGSSIVRAKNQGMSSSPKIEWCYSSHKKCSYYCRAGGGRTHTVFLPADFKSAASANIIKIDAKKGCFLAIYSIFSGYLAHKKHRSLPNITKSRDAADSTKFQCR
jgi:hypothetical protein